MLVITDPGPPEERTLDSVVLSGRSEKEEEKEKKAKNVWHSTDLDSSGGSGSGVGLTSRDHSRHLGFNQCLASGKDMRFSTRTR